MIAQILWYMMNNNEQKTDPCCSPTIIIIIIIMHISPRKLIQEPQMRSCISHLSNKNVLSSFRNESKLNDGSFILAELWHWCLVFAPSHICHCRSILAHCFYKDSIKNGCKIIITIIRIRTHLNEEYIIKFNNWLANKMDQLINSLAIYISNKFITFQ